MKTLIITWKQKYENVPVTYFGLGDMLRGSLKLFRLAKKRGYEVFVDTHLYPCMKFAQNCTSPYTEYTDKHSETINMISREMNPEESFFDDPCNWTEDKIFCMSNHGSPKDECQNEEEKMFLRKIVTPTKELETEINSHIKQLPKTYNSIHARFEDNKVKKEFEGKISYNFNMFDSIAEENDILFTNSNLFRKNCKIPSVNLEISHTGYETDLEKLKNTFIYFHLIANSKKIKSYTEYSWTSGFVWWCKQIYDIPLEVVKL